MTLKNLDSTPYQAVQISSEDKIVVVIAEIGVHLVVFWFGFDAKGGVFPLEFGLGQVIVGPFDHVLDPIRFQGDLRAQETHGAFEPELHAQFKRLATGAIRAEKGNEGRTMVENRKKHRQNSHLIIHFPTSERTSEWPSTVI